MLVVRMVAAEPKVTTIALNQPRGDGRAAPERTGGYDFVNRAIRHLEAAPHDTHVRLLLAREFLQLGLVSPARDLLDAPTPSIESSPELCILRDSLRAIREHRIEFTTHARRFETNLEALARRGVDVQLIREAWSGRCHDLQWYRDRNGNDQLRTRDEDGAWRWLFELNDHRMVAETRTPPDGVGSLMPGPFLFDGLGDGHYFRRVYEATKNTFLNYSCALYVVEPDPVSLAVVLHLHDWADILRDDRILWFLGDGWPDRLRRILDDDPDLPLPRQVFHFNHRPRSGPGSSIEAVHHAVAFREANLLRSLERIEAAYRSRDLPYWAKRFDEALSGQGEPLRILAAVSRHTTFLQYSMRDAKRALEAQGHQCIVLTESSDHHVTSPITYHRTIEQLRPDLFFNIDHLRPEFEGILPANLPLLTWDQDFLPHVFTPENLRRLSPLDFVVGSCKARCIEQGCDPRQFLNSIIPTCPEQFSGDPLTDAERERYDSDLSYVSHASQTPEQFHQQERSSWGDPNARRLLDILFELTSEMLGPDRVMRGAKAMKILDEGCRRAGLVLHDPAVRNRLTDWYLWRLADRMFRHEALTWAADWAQLRGKSLRIYGNNWDQHPTLADFAAGPAQNGRELLCVYRASRINLQLMPAGFLHQRAMDGLAGGGFFLARRTPQDLSGAALRSLHRRMTELDIRDTRRLLAAEDPELRRLLHAYCGDLVQQVKPDSDFLYQYIVSLADLHHPDEVFTDFERILFDSSVEFAHKADLFLADDRKRERLANEMRVVVVERFSYRAFMDRFLRAMAGYLRQAARDESHDPRDEKMR